MNKREAKREACQTTARLLDNYLETEGAGRYDDDLTEQDAERFRTAIRALRDEMDRRG